ncbi:group-specific protein [Lysinibacillus sp. FSL W8-0992]|uniref:group-specific protein n=1 Tax=Lysinibacillus sp. FSL W8-0992 TaxID=2954643 RepID=UPI0030FC8AF8
MITVDTEFYNERAEIILREEAQKKLDTLIIEHTFWDMEELVRQTKMSIPFIRDKFFYHPDFPKFKVGSKWWMPAKETRDFLTSWLKQQPRA